MTGKGSPRRTGRTGASASSAGATTYADVLGCAGGVRRCGCGTGSDRPHRGRAARNRGARATTVSPTVFRCPGFRRRRTAGPGSRPHTTPRRVRSGPSSGVRSRPVQQPPQPPSMPPSVTGTRSMSKGTGQQGCSLHSSRSSQPAANAARKKRGHPSPETTVGTAVIADTRWLPDSRATADDCPASSDHDDRPGSGDGWDHPVTVRADVSRRARLSADTEVDAEHHLQPAGDDIEAGSEVESEGTHGSHLLREGFVVLFPDLLDGYPNRITANQYFVRIFVPAGLPCHMTGTRTHRRIR